MAQDFSIAPYFDDYENEKNFLKVLFQPGKPVQARELNQAQSILQNQVSSIGNHVFANGDMVIPGHVYFDASITSLKLEETHASGVAADTVIPNLVGKIITDGSGLKAIVVHYDISDLENNTPPNLYVKYISAGSDGAKNEFADGDNVYDIDLSSNVVQLLPSDSSSEASIASIDAGVYYVNNYFINVPKQIITLEQSSKKPTFRVGLTVVDEVITENEDPSLFDNALGYSNYAAPGAHRYRTTLLLSKRSFEYNDDEDSLTEKFIDLIHVKNGSIIMKVNDTKYAELNRIFARRTFDESGNYEVNPFVITPFDYRSNNRGEWAPATPYIIGDIVSYDSVWWEAVDNGVSGATPLLASNITMNDGNIGWAQVTSPSFNKGVVTPTSTDTLEDNLNNSNKVAYKVSTGKAYIQGFEVEKQYEDIIIGNKSIDVESKDNSVNPITVGSFIQVNTLSGLPDIDVCEKVNLYADQLGAWSATNATATFTVTGGVITAVTITNRGKGYNISNPPTVSAAGGSDAAFRATVNAAGEIESIKIISGGTGYANGALAIGAAPVAKTSIGTCRVRSIEYESGTYGQSSAIYTLQVFDINMVAGYDVVTHVRSLEAAAFSCNVMLNEVTIPGTILTTAASKNVTGINTSFQSLKVGQTILVAGAAHRISTIESNLLLTTQTAVASTATGQGFAYEGRVRTTGSLIQSLPKSFVKSLRDADNNIDTTYSVKRRFASVVVSGGGAAVLNLAGVGEQFPANGSEHYMVTNLAGNAILPFTDFVATGNQVSINGLTPGITVDVIATVEKSLSRAREKIKTIATKTLDITNVNEINSSKISLQEADIYRLIKVYKVDGEGVPVADDYPVVGAQTLVDITDQFMFHDGQTPFSYEVGQLIRRSGVIAPNNTIRVVFTYFNHSVGDYFSVDSYVDVPWDRINPVLRDGLDFRPRISDNGTDYLTSNGASVTEPIVYGEYFTCDYNYYVPRKDVITVDQNGLMNIRSGLSGYSLRYPNVPSTDMVLAEVTLHPGPLTVDKETVEVKRIETKRYTMEDIGHLDNRLSNVEYYTQLSLLEKETINMDVVDQNGMSRFKSGIQTDSFKNQAVGDSSHPDFSVAYDMVSGEARAFVDSVNVELKEMNLTDAQRYSNGYKVTGSWLTLPYEEVTVISQPLATRSEFVNPFAVVNFNGRINLEPKEDQWAETKYLTDLVHRVDVSAQQADILRKTGKVGTVWNNWNLSWSTTEPARRGTRTVTGAASNVANVSSVNGLITTWALNNVSQVDRSVNWTANRTGTESYIISQTSSSPVSENHVRVDAITYARTIPVSFRLSGARPSSIYNASLADRDIIENIDMATDINISGFTTLPYGFDYYDNTELNETSPFYVARVVPTSKLRQYSDVGEITEKVWKNGEIVIQYQAGNSGTLQAYGVVLDVVNFDENGITNRVIKVIQTSPTPFTLNRDIYVIRNGVASLSVVANKVVSVNDTVEKVITDSMGNAFGVFYPPCTESNKVPSGKIEFKIDNTFNTLYSKAAADFTSNGTVDVLQRESTLTIGSTIATRSVTQGATGRVSIVQPPPDNMSWLNSDPLAQTFMINEADSVVGRDEALQSSPSFGAFITSVGLYFHTKDETLPVIVQIRNVVNGYPGGAVLGSKTLSPAEVNVSEDASLETVVTFPTLVLLERNVEYAVVIMSNSITYKVWISRMGERVVNSNTQIVMQQPSLGSLFKSQNSSTWTAEQYEDLKFNVYRAQFDITKQGNALFTNKNTPYKSLTDNSLYALLGSKDVRVYDEGHGFSDGDFVTIKGADLGPFAGLEVALGDGTIGLPVSNVTYDSYTIVNAGTAAATYTGYFGGNSIIASTNIRYSTVMPNISAAILPGTDCSLVVTPMMDDYLFAPSFTVLNKENAHFTNMMKVGSKVNEDAFVTESNKKSFKLLATLVSDNELYSPVINLNSTSVVLVRNKINNPDSSINEEFDTKLIGDDINVTYDFNDTDSHSSLILFEGADYTAALPVLSSASVGHTIKVGVPTTAPSSANVNNQFAITGLEDTGTVYRVWVNGVGTSANMLDEAAGAGKNSKLYLQTKYVDVVAPYGTSVLSTYVAKPMQLSIPATSMKIMLNVNKPEGAYIDVYYRGIMTSDYNVLEDQVWTLIDPEYPIADNTDFQKFVEVNFEKNSVPSFDICQVKVVLRSDNEALSPRISNLRVMALA